MWKNKAKQSDLILQVKLRLFINQAQDYFLVFTDHVLIQIAILMTQDTLNSPWEGRKKNHPEMKSF